MRATISLTAVLAACGSPVRTVESPSHGTPAVERKSNDVVLARRLLTGDGIARDRWHALEIFMTDCRTGSKQSCAVILSSLGAGASRRWEAARALWPACKRGDSWACALAASVDGDREPSSELLQARCASGLPGACFKYSQRYGDWHYAQRACELGYPNACMAADKLNPTLSMSSRLPDIYKQLCRDGDAYACPDDMPLLGDDCLHGMARQCQHFVFETGWRTKPEVLRAACAINPELCVMYAGYATHLPVPNLELAREAYSTGCLSELDGTEDQELLQFTFRVAMCRDGADLFDAEPDGHATAVAMRARACWLGDTAEHGCAAEQPLEPPPAP